jgi:hypothetical protein
MNLFLLSDASYCQMWRLYINRILFLSELWYNTGGKTVWMVRTRSEGNYTSSNDSYIISLFTFMVEETTDLSKVIDNLYHIMLYWVCLASRGIQTLVVIVNDPTTIRSKNNKECTIGTCNVLVRTRQIFILQESLRTHGLCNI